MASFVRSVGWSYVLLRSGHRDLWVLDITTNHTTVNETSIPSVIVGNS